MATVLGANSVTGGYDVENSCRFNDASSDHLLIAPSGAGNLKTWTWSAWVKRGQLGTRQLLFSGYDQAAGLGESIEFTAGDKLEYDLDIAGTDNTVTSAMVFRDTSAWYNIIFVKDLTQGTETDRIKVFVNGVQITLVEAANGYPGQNATSGLINAAGNYEHHIGTLNSAAEFFDGYMSEVVFIDGTANDEEDFGEFDEDSGIWKPIDVSGLTFGTNGFYLEFKQAGTGTNASGMGADTSGNTNHLAVANLTAVDQSTDTCTNNFATFNSLTPSLQSGGVVAYSEGNTKIVTAYSNTNYLRYPQAYTTLGVTTGKWYAEFKIGAIGSAGVGIANTGEFGSDGSNNPFAGRADSGAVYTNGGEYRAGAFSDAGSQGTYTEDDIIGCALDLDNLAIYWHKNGTYINSGDPTSGSSKTGARAVQDPTTPGGFYVFTAGADNTGVATIEINLGSPSYSESGGETDGGGIGNFNQAVPSGYFALCTKNLAKHG